MVELESWRDFVGAYTLVLFAGAAGGLAFELLQSRSGELGRLERPHRSGRFLDLGAFANVIVGMIAAAAALWIFPPETRTVVGTDATATTVREYAIPELVGLSLIVGSAGASFLGGLQSRALALVKDRELKQVLRVTEGQLQTIGDEVTKTNGEASVLAKIVSAKEAIADCQN